MPLRTLALAAALSLSLHAPGQPQEPTQQPAQPPAQPPSQPSPQAPAAAPRALRDLMRDIADQADPLLRAGLRAHILREAQAVAPVVIIAPDARAAAEAIGRWRGLARFPVLIDDGSADAAENIARFVRAFRPARVDVWTPDLPAWPGPREDRYREIAAALARTLGIDPATLPADPAALHPAIATRLAAEGLVPPGIVLIDPDDDAWIAGLALAAARLQLLVPVDSSGKPDGAMPKDRLDALAAATEAAADASGLTWRTIGDDLDAITLCLNTPTRLRASDDPENKDVLAITDALGRIPGDPTQRWAYAGQIFGDPQQALYRAMCGLFLTTDRAWLFDGYTDGPGWSEYDMTKAADILKLAGFSVDLIDQPNHTAETWRGQLVSGLDAGLIMVNTKGGADRFQLEGGSLLSGHLPLLRVPAAVNFVHSFSAAAPASRHTIAARFLDHGAYAYFGSVAEPRLDAFVTAQGVAGRLAAGVSFAAALRYNAGEVWKLNVLADPLLTFRRPAAAGNRTPPDALTFENATPITDLIAQRVKAEDFPAAVRLLTIAGKDEEAARLAAALLKQRPEAFGNDLAKWAALPLFRTARYEDLLAAMDRGNLDDLRDTQAADAMWHAARALADTPNVNLERVLRGLLRPPHEIDDAVSLATLLRRRAGAAAATAYLQSVIPLARTEQQRKLIDAAIERLSR